MAIDDIRNLDFGRTEAGRKSFIEEYRGWINQYKNSINGEKFQNLLKAIDEGWSGVDADAFKKKLHDIASTLVTRVDKYAQIAEQTLNADAARFDRVQNVYRNDVNSINTNL